MKTSLPFVHQPYRSKARRTRPALVLRLYVAGKAPNSLRAIANTEAICAEAFAGRHRLEIVNLLEHPRRALEDGVVVTPTLLKLSPLPAQRVVGNLDDKERLRLQLGDS